MDPKNDTRIELRPLDALLPNAGNPRSHSKAQIEQIARSIREFGFLAPVIIDSDGTILAGHGRVLAAKRLDLKLIPIIPVNHLTETQKRAYILADNKIAINASWDEHLLAVELGYLSGIEIDIDPCLTGFSMPEIDIIIESAQERTEDEEPIPSLPMLEQTVSRTGDCWQLGSHRVFCGDARSEKDVARLMAGSKAQMAFIDPPYNLAIGDVCGRGSIKHRNFAMACGELNSKDYVEFLKLTFSQLAKHSRDGALHYICSGWQNLYELLTAARSIYSEQKALCVWNKNNGGQGSFYRSKFELIAVLKIGNRPHINNVELGRYGRNRTNVWDHPGVNTFREGRLDDLRQHPTTKPLQLVLDALLDASRRNGIILDTFLGSGTTILAADRVGRRGYGLEIDPRYVDVVLRRWMRQTGELPIHIDTGNAFDAVAFERGVQLQENPDRNED